MRAKCKCLPLNVNAYKVEFNMKTIIIAIVAIGIAIALLSIGVILRKDGQFRSEHISQNARMRKEGIHCATSQDREARKKRKFNIKELE